MYSRKIVEENLERASQLIRQRHKLGREWELRPATLGQIEEMSRHLDGLRDQKGQLSRDLTREESLWILCEATTAKLDFWHFATSYAWIEDWESRVVRFDPNKAQRLILREMAGLEEQGVAMMLMFLKARQLGITTLFQILLAHRTFLFRNVNALTGSAEPEKSKKMVGKLEFLHEKLPWWMRPRRTAYRAGELLEYGDLNSMIQVHWGNQKQGIGRGDTATIAHLSELASFLDPASLVDASLMRAMHENPFAMLALESTAEGIGNWWHRTWEANVTAGELAKLIPIFLPWFLGDDLYPTKGWLRRRPRPRDWTPGQMVREHASAAAAYVRETPRLVRELGRDWEMSLDQQWFYEVEYEDHKKRKQTPIFLSEMPACVAGDMKVCTDKGIIPIRDAFNLVRTDTGPVTKWMNKGIKQTYWINTMMRRRLRVTADHQIAMIDGSWKRTDELVKGDKIKLISPIFALGSKQILVPVTTCSTRVTTLTEDLAKLLGYFMGDGCFSSRDTLEIACDSKDGDVIEDVTNLIERVIGRRPKHQDRGGMILIRSCDLKWKPLLRDLGCIESRGEQGWKRKIGVPNIIWQAPKEYVRLFLSALFECDGHQYPYASRVHFFTAKEQFARDVQFLLMGFGINAPVKIDDKLAGDGHRYIGREIQLGASNARIFNREIGFLSERKRTAGLPPKSKKGWTDPLFEDKVESVEIAGETDVYDLTVPGPDSFGAEGIVVHNCPTEAFQSSNPTVFDPEVLARVNRVAQASVGEAWLLGGREVSQIYDVGVVTGRRLSLACRNGAGEIEAEFELGQLERDGWPDRDPEGKLYVWEPPQRGESYGIGIDPSEGVGEDWSVVQVIKRATPWHPDEQVAEWGSARVGPHDLWAFVFAIAHYYTTLRQDGSVEWPMVVVETNIAAGDAIQTEMLKRGWASFYQRTDMTKIGETAGRPRSLAEEIGWRTTRATRPKVISLMRKMIRDELLIVRSPWLAEELGTLEYNLDRQRIEASRGNHDDRFMAAGIVLAAWYDPERYGSVREEWREARRQEALLEEMPRLAGGPVGRKPGSMGLVGSVSSDGRSLGAHMDRLSK